MTAAFAKNPILNSPFRQPDRHWVLDDDGAPTGSIAEGRRRSEFVVPVPAPRKKVVQGKLAFDLDERGSQRTPNHLINQIRADVDRWRELPEGQWGVTYATQRLLKHWRDKNREQPFFFCQIEAVETIIWLTEVRPKAYRDELERHNAEANPELFRLALKMATGAGKTTVMAMLIAWHAVNKARQPNSRTFADSFLIIAPGITIRDRLRVLLPSDPENYYETRDLVPREMRDDLHKAKVIISNFHAFRRRETLEASKLTKQILKGHGKPPATLETDGQMVARVCRELMGSKQIVVINDEAHHCYREKQGGDEEALDAAEKEEAKRNAEAARIWISGIEALQRVLKTRALVYDLSATPFFLRGSGYREGTLFGWVVSDFSLMDAIESGIVKVPRVPVQDVAAKGEAPLYRTLYEHVKGDLPRAGRAKNKDRKLDPTDIPELLIGALQSLYDHYRRTSEAWTARGQTTPPVFIVVCNNTSTSKLVYDYVAGYEIDGRKRPGAFDLFNNVDRESGRWLARPRTLLIDSEQLDSGEPLSADFKKIAAAEIDAFKREYRIRYPGADAEAITDEQILREVMNTVGKKDRLGEQVRCVVSVSMLTEGWDANTVTHILGVRAFGTQLLCEQVVGRGLRRVSYDPDENGMFAPEYADVLGIPFSFAAADNIAPPQLPKPVTRVRAIPERLIERPWLEIRFPNVRGYRVVMPREQLRPKFTDDSRLTITPEDAPHRTVNEAIVGEGATLDLESLKQRRGQEVAFSVAGYALERFFRDEDGNTKTFVFPSLLAITRHWLRHYLDPQGGTFPQYLLWKPFAARAAEKIYRACLPALTGEEQLRPIIDPYNPMGSSRYVDFPTTKSTLYETAAEKCHLNYVVHDMDWEAKFAQDVEAMPEVLAYVKNHSLHFEVPYVLAGDERRYRPDFIVKLDDGRGPDDPLNLIVEIKGFRREDAKVKAETMRNLWVPSVNNARAFGRWSFLEIGEKWVVPEAIRSAITPASDPPLIRKTPDVCSGAARVRDTRIPVWTLVRLRDLGAGEAELLDQFPGLTPGDLAAAFAYAEANANEIAADLARADAED